MGKGSTADCRRQAAPRPRRSPDDRAAHDYAELGLRHLPCRRRGKESLIEDWPNRATADPATIAKWRRRWPGCNWALATGPGSGVFVLDVDGPEGETALAELERRHGPLPDLYPMQWTGSGVGWQGFFAYPDGRDVRNRRLGPKLETRGDGGYVILPPSIHPSGRRYAWAEDRGIHDVDPPPAPGWLLDLIDPPPSRVAWVAPRPPADPGPYALRALESELALVAVAPTGRRNDQLNRSAHSLFRLCPDGRLPAAVVACGLLAAGAAAGLAEREAARTIKERRHGARSGPMSATFDPRTFVDQAADWQRSHGLNGHERHARELDVIWADDIALDLDRPGLVDGLLPESGLTVIYGPSGCGKTFTVLDIACHVAAGRPWRGYPVQQGVVVYIAAESPKSVERRVWAWKRHHGAARLPLVVVRSSVDLLNGSVDDLLALLEQVREAHGRVALVVVDTLARAMCGNENSPDDMGAFVAACGRMRDASGAHVLVVHHSGKDELRGARGHSSLRAATDVEIEVTKAGDSGALRVVKNRDGEEGQAFGFRLAALELGENAAGRMVTTCVTIEADAPAGGARKRQLGANERIVFDALAAAIADHAEEPPPATDIPHTARGATVERWQEVAERYLPHAEQKRKREAFGRACSSLVASRVVGHAGGFAWLP